MLFIESISGEIGLRWMPQNHINLESRLVHGNKAQPESNVDEFRSFLFAGYKYELIIKKKKR